MGMLACTAAWTSDGQACMSMQDDSPEYEYRRRLREHKVRSNRLSRSAPDGGHADGHACMHSCMDIGRASLYEYAGRQSGIRIQAAIAGAQSAEQSAFALSPGRRPCGWSCKKVLFPFFYHRITGFHIQNLHGIFQL